MEELGIVLGLLQQNDDYLLQLRDNNPDIGAAGLIGCFGGKINPDEPSRHAVVRELAEETTLVSKPKDWEELGTVKVESDYLNRPVQIHAIVYRCIVASDVEVAAKDGQIVRLDYQGVQKRMAELTPATRVVFKEIL